MSDPAADDTGNGTAHVHGRRIQVDLLLGFGAYMVVGFMLLSLPWMQTREGNGVLDNLFTAVSAVSTTGLTTVTTGVDYTLLGQVVILALIQVGGLGFLTLGSFFFLTVRRRNLDRFHTAVAEANFDLPDSVELHGFVRRAVVYTFSIEAIGAAALYLSFGADTERRLWTAIFHSVSAFCTAGFSTFPSSLVEFGGDAPVAIVTLSLAMMGALGFIVINDVAGGLRRRQPPSWATKVIVVVTLALLVVASTVIAITDDALTRLPIAERLLASVYQAGTAITTVGFSTRPTAEMLAAPMFVVIVLMVIGASPSGTGGGVKTVPAATNVASAWANVRQKQRVRLFGRQLETSEIHRSSSTITLYLSTLAIGVFVLLVTESGPAFDIVFEAVSAQGTVGLSRGITGDLTGVGKTAVMMLMVIGRLGALTFAFALVRDDPQD